MRFAGMVVDIGKGYYYVSFNGLCEVKLSFDMCKQKYKIGDIIYINLEI